MRYFLSLIILCFVTFVTIADPPAKNIRILVITGGHTYKVEQFNQMLASLGDNISYEIAEFPAAYDMFLPENRGKYDVLVFYHMWQKITDDQAKVFIETIKEGKPVVALHHSICAFDEWPEYWNIIGGKYFHKTTTFKGTEHKPGSYIHDVNFKVNVANSNDPVTKGITDFDIFDETYKGYYVEDGVKPLLTTNESSSTPVIGWSKKYGKAKIVVLQSGHDVPTFENPNFRKLLKQSIEWVCK
jgi:type 1 glutamine amidotransferase